MLSLLKDYKGKIEINGQSVDSIEGFEIDKTKPIHIILTPNTQKAPEGTENGSERVPVTATSTDKQYKITVKQYMTKPASIDFDFMEKWNNNKPMPMRTMVGVVEKETRGMVYMKLHGVAEQTITCMRCGRELTNPISQLYGIGPECITKIPIFFDIDIEDVENIKKKMVNVTWEGWIIKSAIVSQTEI